MNDHTPETPASPSAPASATAVRPQPPRLDQLPPFKVLLHNDDVNDRVWVVDALVAHTPVGKARAVEVMLEADRTGLGLILVTNKEAAEFYAEQLRSKRLTVTIEPA
ncbi:MAG: hypothetical protein HBSAPP03_05630 [Phycisphaerae bacterium]|nr:MAG: hypothetical protein HBSAPP03_05630 [Phycisphaerae bacterium]